MYGVMASYYGCFFRLVKIRIRIWLVLSLINRYDHLQRSLCFLVVGNVKTFDFESCSLFSFAFQLTLQNPNIAKLRKENLSHSCKFKAQSSKSKQFKEIDKWKVYCCIFF